MSEREKSIEFLISQQVVNAEFYNTVCQQVPLLSKFMMDKFKSFLSDTYFTDLERQTMLMQFFEKQTNIDIIKEIVDYVQGCECKDDYTKVVLEWSYHNSEKIIKSNLAKVDGAFLYGKKRKNSSSSTSSLSNGINRIIKPQSISEAILDSLSTLNIELIASDEDGGYDDGDDDNGNDNDNGGDDGKGGLK